MPTPLAHRPDWDQLYEVAAAQDGRFTTQQAAQAGYSSQLLLHHVESGRALRVRRGIYRLVHFPAGEHEDLVAAWLWTEQLGVFSHETALSLHQLSDVLPATFSMTLPESSRRRRLRVPDGFVLHHADIPKADRAWLGAVPVTSVRRTLRDCALAGLSPELLRHASTQALRRGLVTRARTHLPRHSNRLSSSDSERRRRTGRCSRDAGRCSSSTGSLHASVSSWATPRCSEEASRSSRDPVAAHSFGVARSPSSTWSTSCSPQASSKGRIPRNSR